MNQDEIDAINNLTRTIEVLSGNAGVQNDLLRKMAQQQGINVKSINDNLNKFGKDVSDAAGATQSLQKAEENYQKSLINLQQATASTVTGFKSLTTALLDSQRSFGKYGSALGSFGDAAQKAGAALGPIGAAAGLAVKGLTKVGEAAFKQADSLVKSYDDLSKVGGAAQLTTKDIANMAHNAGFAAKESQRFTNILKANSSAVAGLGQGFADGSKLFSDLTNVGSKTIAEYSKLGISQEELIQGQADYIALQQASGRSLRSEIQDKAKLQKATLEYQDNLLAISAITGEDVGKMKERQKENLRAVEFQVAQIQLMNKAKRLEALGTDEGRKQAEALRKEAKARADAIQATSDLGNQVATKGLREFISTGTATGKEAQALIRLGLSGAMAEYKKTIKEGGNVQDAAAKFQQKYNEALGKAVDTQGFAIARSQENAEAVGANADTLEAYTKQNETNIKQAREDALAKIKAQKDADDKALNARAKLIETEINVQVGLSKLLLEVNPLVNGFNGTTIAATALAGAATAAAAALALYAGKQGLQSLFGGGKGASGGTGMFGMPGGFGAGAPGGKIPGGAPGIPSGVPSAGGGKIESLSKLGGNALTGIADGLKAFANPMVIAGAAGFGAAIAAIGAGIAGATWLVGKALPTLSEGFGAFEKLDGKKLIDSGKGIGAVGAGLAVFGAGGAAAGIGSIIGNLSDAITNFFGGKTPIDKLVEFSKLDIDAAKTKNNAEAFTAFSLAMVAGGAAGISSGVGEITSSIGDAANKFFKGDPPFKKFVDFSKLDIDGEKTKKNAEALVAFSKAMTMSGLGSVSSSFGNLASGIMDGIGKVFGNKDAIQKFVDFTKLNVDPDKASKLAEAFSKYASGLGTLAGGGVSSTGGAPSGSGVSGGGAPSGGGVSGGGAPSGGGVSGGGAPSGGGVSGGGVSGGGAPSGGAAPAKNQNIQSNLGSIAAAMKKIGITDPNYIKATLGNVMKESGGKVVNEDIAGWANTSNDRIRQYFGDRVAKYTDQQLDGIKSDKGKFVEVFSEIIYGAGTAVGKKMDNTDPGDGYKYRGRGFIQLTGKKNYRDASMALFNDDRLVKNPDLVNDPSVAAPVVAWYMKRGKDRMQAALGFGSGPLNEEQARILSTSQIAGSDIRNKKVGTEILGKVASHQGNMGQYLQAAGGGMFSGPSSGYPVILHGNELVIPEFMIPDMMKGDKPTKTELQPNTMVSQTGSESPNSIEALATMFSSLEGKLSELINAVESGNSTQSKILKYSRA